MSILKIGDKKVGADEPTFIIAEIGINHNGSMDNVFKLIDLAKDTGCDAVKFQKRTPELAVPKDQWNIKKDTPWGTIDYIEYKKRSNLQLNNIKKLMNIVRKKYFMVFFLLG